MIQPIIIAVIFAGALAFIGRMIYRSFQAKHACESGCGKCGAVDFAKIEKQIAEKMPSVGKSKL